MSKYVRIRYSKYMRPGFKDSDRGEIYINPDQICTYQIVGVSHGQNGLLAIDLSDGGRLTIDDPRYLQNASNESEAIKEIKDRWDYEIDDRESAYGDWLVDLSRGK